MNFPSCMSATLQERSFDLDARGGPEETNETNQKEGENPSMVLNYNFTGGVTEHELQSQSYEECLPGKLRKYLKRSPRGREVRERNIARSERAS